MKAALIAFVVFASFVDASKADDDEHIRSIANSAIADMHLPRQVGDFLITHAASEGHTMHVFLETNTFGYRWTQADVDQQRKQLLAVACADSHMLNLFKTGSASCITTPTRPDRR